MQTSNGKPNTDKNHQKIHRQKHMLQISQITSIISTRLLQLHTHKPGQKVNKCNAMHTKHHSKNDPEQKPRDSATECLKELHWLPIQQRIDFKILIPVFKSLNMQTPKYLQELIVMKEHRREGLRSSTKHNLLEAPSTRRKTFTGRAFSTYGPTKWNKLPDNLCTCASPETFKNY